MSDYHTYQINHLIFFLKNQSESNWIGAKTVLEIIDDDSIADEYKLEIILDTFRLCGLFEVGYQKEEEKQVYQEPTESRVGYVVEEYEIEILNAVVNSRIYLN